MSEKRKFRIGFWVGGCLALAVLVVLAAAGLLLGGWLALAGLFGGGPPGPVSSTQSWFTTHVRDGRVEFDLVYGGDTTGIVRFLVADPDGNPLWELSGGGQGKPPKVVYGQVPAGWTQTFPEKNDPPPGVRGKTVKVRIDTRFQVIFGPGVEVNEGDVDVPR